MIYYKRNATESSKRVRQIRCHYLNATEYGTFLLILIKGDDKKVSPLYITKLIRKEGIRLKDN